MAHWKTDRQALREVREAVFVREQGVPVELEWDGRDEGCLHLLAEDAQGTPIGTARMRHGGYIERMAVRADWRGHGVGSTLLQTLVSVATRQGLAELALNAQSRVVGFYTAHGFQLLGGEFLDAGIPHRRMRRRLPAASLSEEIREPLR